MLLLGNSIFSVCVVEVAVNEMRLMLHRLVTTDVAVCKGVTLAFLFRFVLQRVHQLDRGLTVESILDIFTVRILRIGIQ